ncbi:sigma-70 family RNA polymerase sigma factor [Streptomyces sp. KK5PA1]|uniref:Sigma-70 family RNA polymerase sigma factor n=1 Tax=Actinacidiphila acididurans TaxID=2784346 RepID=A0ABS2U0P1_9ACTN|nr:sigma-70 family RNA polymerase sigma factor [Actinacidiphila acididurans]
MAAEEERADREEFVQAAAPFRTELVAHCYRMLGSVHDAEDLVQETYLRAWRGYQSFEGRSSLRFWLYRIATAACLTALEHKSRRFVPAGLGMPSDDPDAPLNRAGLEVSWVQPLPDSPSGSIAHDPAAIVAERGSVRLAMIVALQQLPPKQRAVLILRDVLAWRASEVAELLDTSVAAVNSALQRARAQLAQTAPEEDDITDSPLDANHRVLLDQYVKAFENADIDGLLRLLHDEVRLEMPPERNWFFGPANVGRFVRNRIFTAPGVLRLTHTTANGGQPTLATYWREPDGSYHADALQVLTLRDHKVLAIHAFRDTSLFRTFGLPMRLPATMPPAPTVPSCSA